MSTPAQAGLEEALRRAGGQSALARKVGTYRQKVNGWKKRGKVPEEWVERVAEATGVPVWQLAPDKYWPGVASLAKDE